MESFRQATATDGTKEMLATAGQRVERWDILEDRTLPFEERKRRVIEDIRHDIQRVRAIPVDPELQTREIEALELDIALVESLYEREDNESDLEYDYESLAFERKTHYAQVRKEFLDHLTKFGDPGGTSR